LLASNGGQNAYQIARNLGCNPRTARNAIHKFNEERLEKAFRRGSHHPRTVHRSFDEKGMEALREMLHRSPREEFGKEIAAFGRDGDGRLSGVNPIFRTVPIVNFRPLQGM
jgi:hypothetical protein